MGCSAKAIANFFLQKSKRISHLKLQKLVYISHGWYLAIFDTPLIDDEYAEAWQYGPVFPSLYVEFKNFGARNINRMATELTSEPNLREYIPTVNPSDNNKIDLLNKIWKDYGDFTGVQLSGMTHQEGIPWSNTRKTEPGINNLHIKNDLIKEHYREKYESLIQED